MKFPWIFSEFLEKPKVAIDIFSNFEKFKCILGIWTWFQNLTIIDKLGVGYFDPSWVWIDSSWGILTPVGAKSLQILQHRRLFYLIQGNFWSLQWVMPYEIHTLKIVKKIPRMVLKVSPGPGGANLESLDSNWSRKTLTIYNPTPSFLWLSSDKKFRIQQDKPEIVTVSSQNFDK